MEKRLDLKTGFSCNNNCRFCVQAHKKNLGNRSTEDLKYDLKKARKNCIDVVFTGGEVTIRKDIFELVSYARSLGFRIIQIQSNARMLSYKDFCRKLAAAGANEFSPALHGSTPELHDFLTRAKGSFDQTTRAIRNLKSLGMRIISNTVIVKPNYRYAEDIAKLLVSLSVDQFQMAFVHAIGNAQDNFEDMVPRMTDAVPFIKKALDAGISAGIPCMAEAIPLCLMKDYEQYCSEHFIPPTQIIDVEGVDECFEHTRRSSGKTKFPKCSTCIYDDICEGPWKEYPERFGDGEFRPVIKTGSEKAGHETIWRRSHKRPDTYRSRKDLIQEGFRR